MRRKETQVPYEYAIAYGFAKAGEKRGSCSKELPYDLFSLGSGLSGNCWQQNDVTAYLPLFQ